MTIIHTPSPGTEADPGRHLITITGRPDIVFTSGRGSWLWDEGGRRYLDLVQGWAVNSLGHCHEAMVNALTEQAGRLISPSPAFYNRPMLELAQRLSEVTCFDRVFLANSGAEANEGAVKLARRWGQKTKAGAHEIVTFNNSFHGRTLSMMSASGKPGWSEIFAPMPVGFPKANFNDIDSVRCVLSDRTVAIMLEPVQGEAGVNVADRGFIHELRALATERKLLLIFDEVQTGVGRCGTAFAYEHFGIEPDVMTLAKGIGSGVPLAAVLCKDEFNCFNPGDQGGTYCGNPLMAAVGRAVIDVVCDSAFLAGVRVRSQHLSDGLREVSEEYRLGGERGLGLLRVLVLPGNDADQVVAVAQGLQPTGMLLNAPRPNLLRFMPALTITHEEIEQGLSLLRGALRTVLR